MSCGVLETPRFGRKSNFLFVPGSAVSFECNEGFMLMGDPRRTCTSEGRWDPAEYGYTECMRKYHLDPYLDLDCSIHHLPKISMKPPPPFPLHRSKYFCVTLTPQNVPATYVYSHQTGLVFYSRRVAWIAIAIIIAVILPIIMCVVCAVYCYRKKALREDPDWKMSLPRSRSGSRSNLRHAGVNGNSETDSSTLKKSRSYDKVYRTNEPLDNKPDVDFPAKKWDLDDEDFTSSDGSEFPPGVASKRADDIQFLNRGDAQRQTGRRGVLSQPPIAEEQQQQPHQAIGHHEADDDGDVDSELPPPLPQQQAPQLHQTAAGAPIATYSPTYSGLQRNSSGFSSATSPGQQPQRTPFGFAQRQPNAVRVLPGGNLSPQLRDGRFFGEGSVSPTSASSPVPPVQDVGLPSKSPPAQGTKSTEV